MPQPSPEALKLGDDDGEGSKGRGRNSWRNWEFSKLQTGFPVSLGVQGERGCVPAGVSLAKGFVFLGRFWKSFFFFVGKIRRERFTEDL